MIVLRHYYYGTSKINEFEYSFIDTVYCDSHTRGKKKIISSIEYSNSSIDKSGVGNIKKGNITL